MSSECRAGYICDQRNKTLVDPINEYSCRRLKEVAIEKGFGDIFAGIYCPAGTIRDGGANIRNCPAGHYCEDPSLEPKKCSAGFYCPAKSAVENMFHCSGCDEGATSYSRNSTGFSFALGSLLLAIAGMVFRWFIVRARRNKIKSQKGNSDAFGSMQKKNDIIEIIHERFKLNCRDDVMKLFDFLDQDGDGVLSKTELGKELCLAENELSTFIFKMNRAAGKDNANEQVSRDCFIERFFETIQSVSNFHPTTSDALDLFDRIAVLHNRNLDVVSDRIMLSHLLDSSLSDFLSEKQIVRLIRHFRAGLKKSRSEPEINTANDEDEEEERIHGCNPQEGSARTKVRALPSALQLVERARSGSTRDVSITRKEFVLHYPDLVLKVMGEREDERDEKLEQFDVYFEGLSLHTPTKGILEKFFPLIHFDYKGHSLDFPPAVEQKAVIIDVTGRIENGKMTALMGGSGTGKTSLLNALCGRAYYGNVAGRVTINGIEAKIEDYSSIIGFVTQDDIMYTTLTVKENLVFSGKLRLPRGTTSEYINELADDVMADLGLTRVAKSIVAGVNNNHISGGEKKRVNIGLELMSKPSVLLLDEPTSGLDSTSAMTVMASLSKIVRTQGMTLCAVIHQPRKQIFEMFDSLILLGIGGNMVYHGPVSTVKDYFTDLGYVQKEGETIADWMVDISNGELGPVPRSANGLISDEDRTKEEFEGEKLSIDEKRQLTNQTSLIEAWKSYMSQISGDENELYTKPTATDPPSIKEKHACLNIWEQSFVQMYRCWILFKRDWVFRLLDLIIILFFTIAMSISAGPLKLTTAEDIHPDIPDEYYVLTSIEDFYSKETNPIDFIDIIPNIFKHATIYNCESIIGFGGQVSVVLVLCVVLSTALVFSEKRNQFFREAASGYDINAYFLAFNCFEMVWVCIKMILASFCCHWIRNSTSQQGALALEFVLLGWISSGWGFVFPLIPMVPTKFVLVSAAIFTSFSSLMLSGNVGALIKFKNIYRGEYAWFAATIAGLFAPSRFFIESIAVNELKSTPVQHGFTDSVFLDPNTNKFVSFGFNFTSLGMHDPFVHEHAVGRIWTSSLFPSLMVGLTLRLFAWLLLHLKNRPEMLKGPIVSEMWKNPKKEASLIYLLATFILFLALSCFAFLKDYGEFDQCKVTNKSKLGDGTCDGNASNNKLCRYDGATLNAMDIQHFPTDGDCADFNRNFPFCNTTNVTKVGDGVCNEEVNTTTCKFDGRDCLAPFQWNGWDMN